MSATEFLRESGQMLGDAGTRVVQVRGVPTSEWSSCLKLLFAEFPPEEQPQRVTATLEAVAAGRIALDGLRWAWADGRPVGVSLTIAQPDGITLVWPPVVVGYRNPSFLKALLLDELTQRLDAEGITLSQMIVNPEELQDVDLLREHGFSLETDLFYLARGLQDVPAEVNLEFEIATFAAEANTDRFVRTLEATYEGSADCTVLNGLRTGNQALETHQLSGVFDPSLWQIFTSDGVDAAICLVNDHPDQDAAELVYLGVAPDFRGRGMSRTMLIGALRAAAARGRAVMFLAVDSGNRYANAVYSELGFSEIARRRVLFRRRWSGNGE